MENLFRTVILPRLAERSTYLGLITVLTALGVTFAPGVADAVVAAGVAVGGLVLALFPENGKA